MDQLHALTLPLNPGTNLDQSKDNEDTGGKHS